jgi:hypothetical protein
MALPEQIKKQSEAISKFYDNPSADEAQQEAAATGSEASTNEEANSAPKESFLKKKKEKNTVLK